MTDKELRRLHREDLLQILIAQQKQIEDLTAALEDSEKALQDRRVAIEESGSLAEAGAFARPRTEAPAAPEDDSDKRKSGLFRRK